MKLFSCLKFSKSSWGFRSTRSKIYCFFHLKCCKEWTFWEIYWTIMISWGHYTYLRNCSPYLNLKARIEIVFIFEVLKKFLRFSFDWIQDLLCFFQLKYHREWTFWEIYRVIMICWGHYTYLPNCSPCWNLKVRIEIVFIFEVFKKFLRFSFD